MLCKLPSCVNQFIHWYRADRLDLGAVSLWEDQSGTADFTQAVVGSQPVNLANQINGLPAVYFDDRFLAASMDTFSGRRRFLVSAVVRKPIQGDTFLHYGDYPNDYSLSISWDTAQLAVVNSSALPNVASDVARDANFFSPVQDWFRVHVLWDGKYNPGNRIRFFRDGVEQAHVLTGAMPDYEVTVTDQTLRLGRFEPLITNIDTQIAEIIISFGGFNQMEEIDSYFETKFNL